MNLFQTLRFLKATAVLIMMLIENMYQVTGVWALCQHTGVAGKTNACSLQRWMQRSYSIKGKVVTKLVEVLKQVGVVIASLKAINKCWEVPQLQGPRSSPTPNTQKMLHSLSLPFTHLRQEMRSCQLQIRDLLQ
eukprot:5697575-Karenia_brevis.AAC.1